ncbi:MAG: polysaccharide biosynthesis tyrosine autokinase [Cetobacterium sp.]
MEKKDDFYEEKDDLDLVNLFFTIVRRWKTITLIAIPIFIIGVFFAVTRPTLYQAEMKMMVSGKSFNLGTPENTELSANHKLATTYSEIAKSKSILNSVIRKYDLEISIKELQDNITIVPISDTELLHFTFKNRDAVLAATVLNEIGNEVTTKIREIMNFQNIKIIESAEVPKESLPKKRMLILTISLVFSITIGTVVAFIIEFFFSNLRKVKDIENILGISMLGALPESNLSLEDGSKNTVNYKMNEAFRVIRTKLYFKNDKKTARTMIITSSIPGEGKSTIALNYAESIAITGKKVLLIDCNIRKSNLRESFDISFDKGLETILLERGEVKNLILKNIRKNLDILPTKSMNFNVTDINLGDYIKILLNELKHEYNTIILDTSSLIIASDAAILSEHCDGIIYVVGYDQVSKRELEFGKAILDDAKANMYGFIVNGVEGNLSSCINYGYYNNYSYYKDYYTGMKEELVKEQQYSKGIRGIIEKIKREYKKQLYFGKKVKKW